MSVDRGSPGCAVLLRFAPKLSLRWELRIRRTNQPPRFDHLTRLSARGYGRERNHAEKDGRRTGVRSFHRAASSRVNRDKDVMKGKRERGSFLSDIFRDMSRHAQTPPINELPAEKPREREIAEQRGLLEYGGEKSA